MALPFWMAMDTESSSCFAASCRDQRDRCSAAAPLMTSSRVTASDARPPHVSTTKGSSSASWRVAMAATWRASAAVCGWLLRVSCLHCVSRDQRAVCNRHVGQHVLAWVDDLQIGSQPAVLSCRPVTSRLA